MPLATATGQAETTLFVISRMVRGEKLAGWIFAALRFGLLASATILVVSHLIILYPTTRYSDSWLTTGSTVLAFTVPLVAAYGAWIATRGSSFPASVSASTSK